MGRIQIAFDRRLRELFAELGARDREKGLAWFKNQAEAKLAAGTPSLSHAYTDLTIDLIRKFRRFRERKHGLIGNEVCRIHCDAGLGGLARWLRASGCDAFWRQDITDAELVRETQQLGGILLTTDSMLLDRRPIVRREIRAIWIPPTLTIHEQLRYVRAELNLPQTAEPRCMRCGGELAEINKEAARDRIPPRTYKWLDEFYECTACRQLFWHGTHWQRIQSELKVGRRN